MSSELHFYGAASVHRYRVRVFNRRAMRLGYKSMPIRSWTGIRRSPYRRSNHEHRSAHPTKQARTPGRAAEAVLGADPSGRLRGLRSARRSRRTRGVPVVARRGDHGGGDVGPHGCGRRLDVGAAEPGRRGELRSRLRHDGCGRRGRARRRREQYARRADRLCGRHRRGADDRCDAAVLRVGPVCAGGPMAG